MNFGLLIIGDEILSGKREDKHLPKVIELLSARGLSLSWARYVGDDPTRITQSPSIGGRAAPPPRHPGIAADAGSFPCRQPFRTTA